MAGIGGGEGKQVVHFPSHSVMDGETMKEKAVIIIAEDDPGHAFLIRKNLARHGVGNPIIHCGDGQEVLDFFQSVPGKGGYIYDSDATYVLLLDVRMPKVDGIEVLRYIKSAEHLRDTPVIMVTTTADPVDVESSIELGCNGYITKPVDYGELIRALEGTGLF